MIPKQQFDLLVYEFSELKNILERNKASEDALQNLFDSIAILEKSVENLKDQMERLYGVKELEDRLQVVEASSARNIAALRELAGKLVPSEQLRTNTTMNLDDGKGYWKEMNHPELTSAVNKYIDEKALNDTETTIMLQYLKNFVDDRSEHILSRVAVSREGIDLLLSELIKYSDPLSSE